MTEDATTWAIAGLQMAIAVGIAIFWLVWLRRVHDEPWLPEGYVDHEYPFFFSDSILALVLLAGAILQVFEEPVGDSLGLFAAGMLAFLGILDLAYFARTGMFKREHGGLPNAVMVSSALLLAIILVVRFV